MPAGGVTKRKEVEEVEDLDNDLAAINTRGYPRKRVAVACEVRVAFMVSLEERGD